MSSSCRVGKREKFGGDRDMKTWHALELAAQKQYTPQAFPWLPCSLLHFVHLELSVASDHVKGSLSLPPLTGCLISREQSTSRAKRQWPACLHPSPFLFLTLCDMGMPLIYAKCALKCYWMLRKPPICLQNTTIYHPGRRQMIDARTQNLKLNCHPMTHPFLGNTFPLKLMPLALVTAGRDWPTEDLWAELFLQVGERTGL